MPSKLLASYLIWADIGRKFHLYRIIPRTGCICQQINIYCNPPKRMSMTDTDLQTACILPCISYNEKHLNNLHTGQLQPSTRHNYGSKLQDSTPNGTMCMKLICTDSRDKTCHKVGIGDLVNGSTSLICCTIYILLGWFHLVSFLVEQTKSSLLKSNQNWPFTPQSWKIHYLLWNGSLQIYNNTPSYGLQHLWKANRVP